MRLGKRFSILGSVVAAGLGLVRPVDAASVSITPVTLTASTNYDLTATGSADWIRWRGDSSNIASPSLFDHDSAGGSTISTWTALPGSGGTFADPLSGTNNNVTFSWTNGTPTATGTNTSGYVWDDSNGLDSTNHGFTFSVAANTNTYDLRFYAANWVSTAKLIATLVSPSSTTLDSKTDTSWTNSNIPGSNNVQTGYYDVIFTGAEAGDTLNVTYEVGTNLGSNQDSSGNGYIGISAASLAVVPEPGIIAMAVLGLLPLIRCRRR